MILKITHHTLRNTLVIAIVLASAAFFGWQAVKQTSHAADIRNFDPGNIMSDAVMSNKSTMSVQDIQNFLNSKNYCDNTDTYKAAWYPHLQYSIKDGRFVCMARESFNGESAAQIIWQAGQDYNINPQVLIVMLEKEQGLVSDTWPNHVQYRTAMGYGCPDTAPCDTQYYGLKNQVRLAANLLRTVLNGGWSNYPVGQRYVQYHPNAGCGGTVINIQNRATSALYRYTPYQPNQAALNAGYGIGDDCSAYGNRNFWRLFTDWFGSPTQGQHFTAMDEPRKLYTPKATIKIDPETGNKTEDLPAGLSISFQQKTFYRSKVCLRTETDTRLNKQMCVLEDNLSEIFTSMAVPRKMITRSATIKIDPETGNKTEDLPAGLEIAFSQISRLHEGRLCLRTATDQRLGKQMCVLYDNLYETYDVFRIMDNPRSIKVKRNANKVNPITNEAVPRQTVVKGQLINFSSRSTTNDGKLCLRTEANTQTDSNMCILYDDLIELNAFTPLYTDMSVPRKLVTNRETIKIDATTRARYDPLPKGLIIDFTMKTEVDGELCLRTKTDTYLNKNSCVLYSDLKEV